MKRFVSVKDAMFYSRVANAREGTVPFDYATIVGKCGEGFTHKDDSFPDDTHKVDACFLLVPEGETPTLQNSVAIWNYKNGPAYNPGDGLTLADIETFSACTLTMSLIDDLCEYLKSE